MFTLLPVTLDICIVYNSDIVWSQQATTSFKHLADVKLNQNKCHFFHPQSETPLLLRFLRSDRFKTGSPSHRCRGWGQPRDSDALLLLLPFLGRRGWESLWVSSRGSFECLSPPLLFCRGVTHTLQPCLVWWVTARLREVVTKYSHNAFK